MRIHHIINRTLVTESDLITNSISIDALQEMQSFVEEELEDIDSRSIDHTLDASTQAKLEKDYRALTAVEYVIKNHMKALRNPELLKTSIFIYDWDEDSSIGAVQVRIQDTHAEILWLGSYYSSGKELLKAAAEQARAKGAKKIKVTSKWESEEYYRKQGFAVTNKRDANPITDVGSDLSKDIAERIEKNGVLLEYNRQVTKRQFGKQLVNALRKDRYYMEILRDYDTDFQDSDEYLVDGFLNFLEHEIDVKYIPWAVSRYIKQEYRYEDVVFRFGSLLDHFNRVMKPYLKRMGKSADIMQYSFKEVEDFYYSVLETDLVSGKDLRKSQSRAVREQSEILYDGSLGLLVIPRTQEASCYWGRGTRWCTAASKSENMFDAYSADGPLYIWIDTEGDRYQFHFPSEQFMDAKDSMISNEMFNYFRNEHPVVKQAFQRGEREFMMDPDIGLGQKLDYAYYRADSRIPTLEEFMIANENFRSLGNYISYFSESLAETDRILAELKPAFDKHNHSNQFDEFSRQLRRSYEHRSDPSSSRV